MKELSSRGAATCTECMAQFYFMAQFRIRASDCMSASLEVWGEGQERTCVTPIIIRLSPARLLRLGACLEVDVLERFVSRFIVIH